MNSNQDSPDVASASLVSLLEDRLLDCVGSEDYVAVIRALAATRDPTAIHVLASLLDSVGPIAQEAIVSLLTFGDAVIPAMRGCVDSLDYDMIRHGHEVLAALGDAVSQRWLRDDLAERIAVYCEHRGISLLLAEIVIANDTDEPSEVA
jgi:hypothetical protein